MSVFASQVTKVVPVPGAEPHTMTVRKLSGRQYATVIGLFKANDPTWRNKAIEFGVTAWTLDKPLEVASLDDLVDEVVDAIGIEVMKLTKPAFFLTEGEQQADQKNG